jgi:Na+-translocating ferredoxin:NAD+ oxidoreductase RNF subunit RnfB
MDTRELECCFSGCPAYGECIVKYGNECIRNGGRKVPRFGDWFADKPNVHLVASCGPGEEVRMRYGTDIYFD